MSSDLASEANPVNRQIWLKSRPNGIPRAEDFGIRTAAIPAPLEGEFLVRYAVGDTVMGIFGWQDNAAVQPKSVMRKLREPDLPMSLSLGVLGLNGLTAYFGLLDVCRPVAGETLVW